MLTTETLKANAALSGLTDEQLQIIATLSKNDEEVVIGRRIGELHGQYDKDILGVTGVEKNGTEKTYDYLKRVLADYKERGTKVTELTDKVKKLEKAEGGDETLRQQLKDEKALTTQLRAQIAEKDKALVDATKDYNTKLTQYKVDSAFDKVFAGLNFRQDISEAVQGALKTAARNEVASRGTLEFDSALNAVVVRDTNNEILRNPANSMNPYTLDELVRETSIKDVLLKEQRGAGTGPGAGGAGGGNVTLLDLSTAKTQIDADKLIDNYLTSKGLSVESQDYWTEMAKLREDNNVNTLPIR